MAASRVTIRTLAALAALVTLSGGLAIATAGALDPGVPFDATATVTPHSVLRGQSAVDIGVTVTNHDGDSIGAVLIRRPNGQFLEPATCGVAPAGWIGTPEASGSFIVDGCRFESATGPSDNIASGTSATFHLRFDIQGGNRDALPDSWLVRANTGDTFDAVDALSVVAANPRELDTDVRTFEVSHVVVANGVSANPGDPCPAANATAPVGATRTILVCGFNRGTQSRTPSGAVSSLAGTMIATPGTFASASIPTDATNRVLTKYTGATITGSAGSDKTLVARVGLNVTSPAGVASSIETTFGGFSAYGPVTHLELTAPSVTTAGVPLSATVTAKDATNVVNADYVGAVHVTSTDPQADVPADLTFNASDAGTHSFANGVTLKTAGVQSLGVSDGTLSASTDVIVQPGPPIELRLETAADGSGETVPAQSVSAGASVTLYSVSRDAYGNFVENTAADEWSLQHVTGGVAEGDLTVAADGMSAVLTGNVVGTATVRATRAGLTNGDSGLIRVVPGAPSALVLTGFDDPTTAGEAHTLTVTALDDYGNVATAYDGMVRFSSSDPAAALPADYEFTPGDAGSHTFSATLTTVGERSISVTDVADASRTATHDDITVVHGPAATIALTGSTAALDVGASRVFTATVYDQYSNVVTSGADASANVAFAQIAGAGSVAGTGTVAAAGGVASVTVTGVASGPVTLRASAVFAGDVVPTDANSLTFSVSTQYQFSGFRAPVDNPPSVNAAKAGQAIPVKFGLGGYQGTAIFAAGSPRSATVPCDSSAPVDGIESTANPGASALSYHAISDEYSYVWKTEKGWGGSCRQLVLEFADGQVFRATFRFAK